ncbi:hypothetical protein [Nocardia jinanensis]|uniref:RHIM domain-containing protein n=1 Tax=Nocardia jinanensis TaxID=382504 RepID=A0A917VW35_9NOCA|nr:hypothetical protein [Nocardia jinanensis]GGL20677.1 hypothetical protein GCM10011588_39410 [Nocardia jinanensis]
MDLTVVTAAVALVAAGAGAGLTEAAKLAVTDAYAGLKQILRSRYPSVDVSGVERRPDSEAKRVSLEEDLTEAGAETDEDLLAAAQQVIDTIGEHSPEAFERIGLDLADIEVGGSFNAHRIHASDVGVRVTGAKIAQDFNATDITAGEPPHPR